MINTYLTHDNGGRPFKVIINDEEHKIEVYKETAIDIYSKKVLELTEYQTVFIGKDSHYPQFEGQSILVKISDFDYVYIGNIIFQLHTKDIITQFISDLGNSDVVYDYAIGTENIYLFTEQIYFKKEQYNPYNCYYKHGVQSKRMKKKVIHKRLY